MNSSRPFVSRFGKRVYRSSLMKCRRSRGPVGRLHFSTTDLDEFADIVTVGKITQVCATLYGEAFKPQAPILSQTFTGSSSSIATGLAMLEALESGGCFGPTGKNVTRHEYFAEGLAKLGEKYSGLIRGPFGEGMMIGFTPGDGSFDQAKSLMMTMYETGLLGFVCGSEPTRIRFLPPPATTTLSQHIDAALELLDQSLQRLPRTSYRFGKSHVDRPGSPNRRPRCLAPVGAIGHPRIDLLAA